MAYGVKFRLDFDDVLDNEKRIEILKDGYVKANPTDPDLTIYELIATNDPLQITWDQDDNFYDPIIGSTCQINLFVTDTTNYDNFYDADEREYKIRISYKDSGGNFQIYWEGWLLVDQFQEAVISKPFEISLKGYDGLGSLDGFTQPLVNSSGNQLAGFFMVHIHEILENINLGFDIYVSNDIKKDGSITGYNVFDQASCVASSFFANGVDPKNCKEVLEQLLKFTNSRIFQSYGRWYIINNSSYSEQSVKTSSASTANSGSIPTGIRASETTSLQENGTENILYNIYNSDGVYQSSSTQDILNVCSGPTTVLTKTNCDPNIEECNIPVDIINLNKNLTKEYLRPIKQYTQSVNMTGFFSTNIIGNSGFEFGTSGWSLTNSSIDNTFSFQGEGSLKSTNIQTTANGTNVTAELANYIDEAGSDRIGYRLKLNNFFNSTSGQTRGFRWQVKAVAFVIPGDPPIATRYWNGDTWTTTATINEIEIVNNRRWKSYTFNAPALPNNSWRLYFYLYDPYQTSSTSGFTSTHWDSIILDKVYINEDGSRSEIFQKFDLLKFIRKRTGNFSGLLELEDIILTNEEYQKISGDWYRSRDKTNYVKSLEQITTQQVINDYRDYVLRYEGDFYNNNLLPIGLHNKIWVNFGSSVLQEPVSCYIDSMIYNVKQNTYTIVMHIPNQNDDLSTDFVIKF
jgi:hypothetical protein